MRRKAAQRPLGCVVTQTDPAIFEKPREGRPATEHVVHRLGDIVVPRHAGALLAHPVLQVGNERDAVFPASGEALRRRLAIEGALDVEQRIDTTHRGQRQRRDERWALALCLAAGVLGEIGEDEEFAPRV